MTTTDTVLRLDSQEDYHRFDDACNRLTDMLNEINPDSNEYTSRGENIGWRKQNGTTTVTLNDGHDLLTSLTPDTDWRIKARVDDGALKITMTHHDNPMGETHTLTAK